MQNILLEKNKKAIDRAMFYGTTNEIFEF